MKVFTKVSGLLKNMRCYEQMLTTDDDDDRYETSGLNTPTPRSPDPQHIFAPHMSSYYEFHVVP